MDPVGSSAVEKLPSEHRVVTFERSSKEGTEELGPRRGGTICPTSNNRESCPVLIPGKRLLAFFQDGTDWALISPDSTSPFNPQCLTFRMTARMNSRS